MSQAGIINVAGGGGGGAPIQTVTGDSGGPVPPTANNINLLGGTSNVNNTNGITVIGNAGTSTETFTLTNRISATVTTADATLTTIATFSLGATPGVFSFWGVFSGFITSAPSNAGGTYFCDGSARTTGAAATEIGSDIDTIFEDVAMSASDVFFTVSGNNVVFQVQGIAATTINWRILFEYTLVS